MRRIACLVAVVCVSLVSGGLTPLVGHASGATPAFTGQKTVSRVHLNDGVDDVVDTRTVAVTVSDTTGLRDRQDVTVRWSGAHPTGGLITDHNSADAAKEEYPVVLMQCRGSDDPALPAAQRVSPETCWTQTPDERLAYSAAGFAYPPYRMDRYAVTSDRAQSVNVPHPLPQECKDKGGDLPLAHWIPFVAADGTVYPGGHLGCAGAAPEAANSADSLQPGNTTYGITDTNGNGQAKFVIETADTNASLGCSATTPCTLEVIPIMGISCDAAGTASGQGVGMPAADRPQDDPDYPLAQLIGDIEHGTGGNDQGCESTGRFAPNEPNGGRTVPDQAVSGALWWSASNWRNRISVPLTFAVSASVCNVVSNQAQVLIYGAEAMDQAMQQWVRRFCTDPKLFTLRHVQTSEPQAKNLLNLNNIEAALQGAPPGTPFTRPTVQAPTAVTGFAIAYSIDGKDGHPYPNLKLNARLLAKLLTESYFGCAQCFNFHTNEAKQSGFVAMQDNPYDMSRDPEFKALNPGIDETNWLPAAATLAIMSSDSDLLFALTSYINADPVARGWLDGDPDPWGMVVNPAYKDIQLPVNSWPLLDTHVAILPAGSNICLEQSPSPWLPLVAAPVLNPSIVALDMQFDISNSQTACNTTGAPKQVAVGREAEGSRFLIGLVSLADAARFQENTALLQTQGPATDGTFTDASGRTFVGPTDAALIRAAQLMKPDDTLGTWTLPYDALRTSKAGATAYPGTMLMSTDIATTGLPADDAQRYAQYLRFAAGPAQTAGLGNGQLPPGYVPMTAANGLGAFAAYTRAAADAVAAQKCATLFPSGRAPAFQQCGGAPEEPAAPQGSTHESGPSSSPTTAPAASSPTPEGGPAAAPVQAIPVARTSKIGSSPLGVALPVAAVFAGAFLSLFAWRMGLGRR